jgi:hypothetical protein
MMKRARLLLVLGCLGSFACGNLGDDDGPPLAVVEGRLSQASMSQPAANVRVAVVWNTSTTGYKTSVDVPVSPEFPSKFRLELRDPPPASAMVRASEVREPDPTGDFGSSSDPDVDTQSRPLANGPANYAYAIGSVVAYEDLDQNRQLGLIDPDTAPTDRVLGTNDELLLVYFEGDVSQAGAVFGGAAPVRGYNLLRSPRCTRTPSGEITDCPPSSWLPISTLYDLPLTADPQLGELMCRSADTGMKAEATKRAEPKPAPGANGWPGADDHYKCKSDGKSYTMIHCETTSEGLCKFTLQTCLEETWTLPSTPPPAEWPCPIE